jgi:hypothetical protein
MIASLSLSSISFSQSKELLILCWMSWERVTENQNQEPIKRKKKSERRMQPKWILGLLLVLALASGPTD